MEIVVKPVKFTKRALKDLEKIYTFNTEVLEIPNTKAKEISHHIVDATRILESSEFDSKNIGSIDESFSYLKQEYRKIFYKEYKITYRNGKDKIYITRMFDMNQHPNKNK